MFIKNGHAPKNFHSELSEGEIKRYNTVNRTLGAILLAASILLAFIPNNSLEAVSEKYFVVLSVSVLVLIGSFLSALFCFVSLFKSYRVREAITDYDLPVGFVTGRKCYIGFDVQIVVFALNFLYSAAITVISFTATGLICALIAAACVAISVYERINMTKALSRYTEGVKKENKENKEQSVSEDVEEFFD